MNIKERITKEKLINIIFNYSTIFIKLFFDPPFEIPFRHSFVNDICVRIFTFKY